MKTTLKTSALIPLQSATVHLPQPASSFGSAFQRFLTTPPSDEAPVTTSMPSSFRQPVEFLQAVPAVGLTETSPPTTSLLSVQDRLARCLGSALLLACQPTQQAPSLRQAVMALRQA